jgi:DNA-binding IscR family transcriptional regulator
MKECLTRRLWQEAADAMYDRLNTFTLADLINDAEQCASASVEPWSRGEF